MAKTKTPKKKKIDNPSTDNTPSYDQEQTAKRSDRLTEEKLKQDGPYIVIPDVSDLSLIHI